MKYQNKVKHCLAAIKEQVKKQAVSYQQLANELEVSLLTVKRQLNGSEISMSKLLALCDAAGLNFIEIWQTVESRRAKHTFFTKVQDSAFCKYPHLFHYFIELLHQKKSPKQLEKQWQLIPASTHIYLRKLEQLELIRLSLQGGITFLVAEPLGFGRDSLFVKKDIQKALLEVSEKFGNESDERDFVVVKPMVLSDELRKKMYVELSDLISRYAELSERYFTLSQYSAFQLVTCDYKLKDSTPSINIINVNDLN